MQRRALWVSVVSLLLCGSAVGENPTTFEGPWRTTNRRLDGIMKCVVTPVGREKWQGRFYGVWQGTPFDYTVNFSGPPSKLRGTATIDGADYSWTGVMSEESPRSFQGTFGGSRYMGSFEMKERGPDRVAESRAGARR